MAKDARKKILHAATALFAQKGFPNVTSKQIARRARVNEVTLFRLFGNKRSIFVAVMRDQAGASLRESSSIVQLDHPDFREAVRRWLAHQIEFTPDQFMKLTLRFRLDATQSETDQYYKNLPQGVFPALVGRIEQGQRAAAVRTDIDASVLARSLTALVTYFLLGKAVRFGKLSPYGAIAGDFAAFLTIWLDGVVKKN